MDNMQLMLILTAIFLMAVSFLGIIKAAVGV